LSTNKITLIQTYYNEVAHLERCIERWNYFSTELEIILIDDGSKKNPAKEVLQNKTIRPNIDFSLYEVRDDIGFNSHGCRNLGASVAKGDWLLFLDIDYTMQPGEISYLAETNLVSEWYTLNAIPDWNRKKSYSALNQFLINKKFYLNSGGYDESYTPYHYGDREFLATLEEKSSAGNLENIKLTCWRGGRKAVVNNSISIPEYDDEKMLLYTPKFDYGSITRHNKKINFAWEKVI
jgi:glycosyltransferase involved in cell wall biosynthesis